MVFCFSIACSLKQTFAAQNANEAMIMIPFFSDPASLQLRAYCTCKVGPHRGAQGAYYPGGCPEYLDYCGGEPFGDCCYPAE